MSQHISAVDVTASLEFYVNLMISFEVDDENFIVKKTNRERLLYGGTDMSQKEIILYQKNIPRGDFYILNPYAEGLGDNTPPQIFFYKFLRMGMIARVRMLLIAACKLALLSKGIDEEDPEISGLIPDEVPQTSAMLSLLTGHIGKKSLIDEIDVKTLGEVVRYTKTKSVADSLVDPIYHRNIPGTTLSVKTITSEEFLKDTPGLRKVTAKVIQKLMMNILGISSAEGLKEFASGPTPNAGVRMSSWLETLYKIYQRINPALLDTFPTYAVDMGAFRTHLNNISDYYTNAKFMIVSNAPQRPQNDPAASAVPTIPTIPSVPNQPAAHPHQQSIPTVPTVRPVTASAVPTLNAPTPTVGYTGPGMMVQQPTVIQPPVQGGYVALPDGSMVLAPPGSQPMAYQPMQPAMPPGYAAGPVYAGGGYAPPAMAMQPGYAMKPTTVFDPVSGTHRQSMAPVYGGGASAPGMPIGIWR